MEGFIVQKIYRNNNTNDINPYDSRGHFKKEYEFDDDVGEIDYYDEYDSRY